MTRLAWHFLHPGSRLRTGEAAPPDGEWLKHDGPIVPCESGLHASERAIDALMYAPHEREIVLCRVELAGTIVEHGNPVDKLVASERRILWRLDGETTDRVLREFARWSASQVLHFWDAPRVVCDYLATGDETLRDAAWDAARAAVRDAWAARAAVRDAAWAAWDAARDAAWAATKAASWAAWAAGAAAGAAARAAAWEAAKDAQNTELERLLSEACEARS